MTPRIVRALGALLALGSATAAAQQPPASPGSLDSVIRILRLPRTTTEAREKGVPDSQVGGVIDILRRSRVPAGDAQVILQGEVDAKAAGQPNDNFGAFVQAQHRAGLRGRALADAIHAEQARRGMGRGHGQGKPDTDDREQGGETRGGQGGRPDAAQPATPRTRGRSDTARTSPGRSGGQGRKP